MRGGLICLLLLLIACGENKNKLASGNLKKGKVLINGFNAVQQQLPGQTAIPPDKAEPRKIPAGIPPVTITNTNELPAGKPAKITGLPPELCTPGKDSFSIPRIKLVKGLITPGGIPEVSPAKDAYVKDQNPQSFSTFGKLQGLKHKTIRCMLQDRNGNLWFGTDGGGVCKYDGRNFTHITENEGLSGNYVWSILEDKNGHLWFGTFGAGVCKYDGKSFTRYSENEGLSNNIILSLLEDKNGQIWMGTGGGGVYKFTPDLKSKTNGTLTAFSVKEGLSGNIVLSLEEDKNGNIWFGTDGGGLCSFNGKTFSRYSRKQGLPNDEIRCILEDKDGFLWFGTDGGGVSKFDGISFTTYSEKDGLCNNHVWSILEDRSSTTAGGIWFGTNGGGACRFDGKKFVHYSGKEGLPNNFIWSLLKDNNDNLWFGTDGGGVSKYNGKVFSHFTDKEGLSSNIVSCMYEDRTGNLWIGTYGSGVCRYDGKKIIRFSANEGLSNDDIRSILEDKYGNIWFGTDGNGVCKYTPPGAGQTGNGFFTYFDVNDGLANNVVFCMEEDRRGNLWFGTWGGGISKFDGKRFTNYSSKEGLSNTDVRCILEDRKGNLWFGTWGGGVCRFDGKRFTRYSEKEGLSGNVVHSIMEDRKGRIFIGTFGGGVNIFFPAAKSGEKDSLIHFSKQEGLSDDHIFGLLQDQNNNYYLGTRFGLNCISEKTLDNFLQKMASGSLPEAEVFFKYFGYDDGFLGIGVNGGRTMLQDKKGTIWIGANDRLSAFRPEGCRPDSMPPNMQITGIEVFNEQVSWAHLLARPDSTITLKNGMQVSGYELSGVSKWYSLPENLSLVYHNNYLTFNFIGITLKQSKQVKYQYFLEGLDKNWSGLTSRNSVTYGNLPAGSYTFLVKAMNSDGIWSNPYRFSFTIRPPWWRTWWAWISYLIITICSAVLFIRWRERTLKERQMELEEKIEEAGSIIRKQKEEEQNIILRMEEEKAQAKDAFLANMSHEIRTPLNAVLGFHDLLKNTNLNEEQKSHVDIIGNALKNLNVIINDILDISKLESGKLELEKRPFSIDILINQVAVMHMAKAAVKNLELRVKIDRKIPPLVSGDETRLSQILINLVSNALKFTENGFVEIKVDEVSRSKGLAKLQFSVSDSGIGIEPSKQQKIFERFTQAEESTTRMYGGTGLGLNIVKSLVEMHGGGISVESSPGKGSVFTFTIAYPVSAEPVTEPHSDSAQTSCMDALKGISILLVEDNEYNQLLAATYLERNGAEVVVACDGFSGLNALQKRPFHIVLMDIEIPQIDGLETTRKIRHELNLRLPVIGCSAHAGDLEKSRCLNAGMDDYITKPYSEQQLIKSIKAVMNNQNYGL